ncbi:hypothetical protein [Nostoc sp.]
MQLINNVKPTKRCERRLDENFGGLLLDLEEKLEAAVGCLSTGV